MVEMVRVSLRLRLRVTVRVRQGGTYFHTHMHARQGCQAYSLMRVARYLVKSERKVKRVAPMPHATKHNQLSSLYTTPAAYVFPYPTLFRRASPEGRD